jgi:hypothetical protein
VIRRSTSSSSRHEKYAKWRTCPLSERPASSRPIRSSVALATLLGRERRQVQVEPDRRHLERRARCAPIHIAPSPRPAKRIIVISR